MSPSSRRLSMRFAFLDMFPWTLLQPRLVRKPTGLGSAPFDRLYSGYRCFFLFLRVLRCFSSPRSPRALLGDRSSTCRVAPFGYLRINVCLQLPVAFRSLPRPSSPPRAKASTVRSCFLFLCEIVKISLFRLTAYKFLYIVNLIVLLFARE